MRIQISFVFCCLLMGSSVLFAQEEMPDSTFMYQQLEQVEVIGAPPTNALDALNHQVIHKEFLLKNQANTFIQSLEVLPGISAIQSGSGISKPVIRGMSLNRVIVNELGIKQENQQWGLDHGLEIDQYNVEEVEIIKGPVALIYGSDGIGGAINILPPKRIFHDTNSFDLTLNYKTGNQLFGSSARYLSVKNNWTLIARMSYQNYADYRVPADSFLYNSYRLPLYNRQLKNTAGREFNQSLMLRYNGERSSHNFFVSNVWQQAGFFPGAFGIPRHFQLVPDESSRNIDKPYHRVNHIKMIYNGRYFLPIGILKSDIGYQINTRQEISNPHAHGNSAAPQSELALKLQLQTFTANHALEVQKEYWEGQVGISFQHQKNNTDGFEFLIPEYQQTQAGIYSYLQSKWTGKAQLSGGIRYDFAAQNAAQGFVKEFDSLGVESGKTLRSESYKKAYHNMSAGLGLKYQFSHGLQGNVHAGTAYRIPLINELLSNGVHHGNFRHELGDRSLQPERGLMFDAGMDYHNDRWHWSVTPFLNLFENYIYLHPSGRFSTLPEAGQIYMYKNTPAAFAGAEAVVDYKIASKWSFSQTAEYVWNQNLNNGQGLPFTPPFSARTEIEFSSKSKKQNKSGWQGTLIGHYFAAQNRVDINEPSTPGYYLIHATTGTDFYFGQKKLGIFLNIQNLLNRRYLNNMSRYRMLNLPEQGLNAQFLIRFEF